MAEGDGQQQKSEDHGLLQKQIKIDLGEIEKHMPGLEAYTKPSDEKVLRYIEELNPIKVQNNVLFLALQLFCLIANMVVIFEGIDMSTHYRVIKQCETLNFLASNPNGGPLTTTVPSDRFQFWDYLYQTFPQRMFGVATEVNFLDEFDLVHLSISTQHSRVIQQDGPD